MGLFLIIIGGIIFLLSGLLWLSCYASTKNQKSWDMFFAKFTAAREETEKKENCSMPVIPEEFVYNLVIKVKNISSIVCISSLIVIGAGIALLL